MSEANASARQSKFSVGPAIQAERIVVPERVGQQRIRQILIAHRTQKAIDRGLPTEVERPSAVDGYGPL